MSEAVQLLPEPEPEREKIFKDWRTGKRTIVQLARDAQVRELLHDLEKLRRLSRHCYRGE
jgi:hypothetical protein